MPSAQSVQIQMASANQSFDLRDLAVATVQSYRHFRALRTDLRKGSAVAVEQC